MPRRDPMQRHQHVGERARASARSRSQ
jgi:hypothetical protein